MADQHAVENSSTSNVLPESSGSTVELNIKTLDSQIYSFHVDKNIMVSMFKEKIASKIDIPVGRQRLIFRGKVLKDNHLLSDYHVENGHTLHLVARQVSEAQSSSVSSSGESNTNSNNAGQDANAAATRPRVTQHRVVLGTFGVGEDQGESAATDISRVIGSVLNSIIGGQTAMGAGGGMMPNMQFNIPVSAPQGNPTEGSLGNTGSLGQAGNQAHYRQASLDQSMSQPAQIPLGTAIAMPSLNVPTPDSLNTLSVFMNRMEAALSQDGGFQPNLHPNNSAGSRPVELPSNARGFPTPAALAIVLRHAESLFSGPAVSSLAHIAERLEQEENSTDATVRSQIQTESMQVGLAMQHLGVLLLELGRTMLMLRIGQSSAESFVNAGPAVYMSPSGPNPLMVQPFPSQASSLFGGGVPTPSNPRAFGPVGVGAGSRHVNIHIHTAVGPRTTNGETNQGGVTGTGDRRQSPVMPRSVSNMPNETQTTAGQPGRSSDCDQSTPSISSDVIRETSSVATRNVESSSGGGTREKPVDDVECAPTSSSGAGDSESGKAVPLGLGLGGLQPKRSRQTRTEGKNSETTLIADQNPASSSSAGRAVLQSLASLANKRNSSTSTSDTRLATEDNPSGGHGAGSHLDQSSVMSQVMQNTALDGLLSGVTQQSGIGSPDLFRNMLGQLTQNPVMMNAVSQIAQQIDTQDPGSMFSGLGSSQSGGLDLSRMFQQMMPIVSQALGGGMNPRQQETDGEREFQPSYSQRRPDSSENPNDKISQNHLQEVVDRIEHQDPPREILRAVVDNAVSLSNDGNQKSDLAQELSSDVGLVNEFMEMLHRDVSKRFQNESE